MAAYAGYSINKSIKTLLNYRKVINTSTEIEKMKTRLNSELSSMEKMIDELLTILDIEDFDINITEDQLLNMQTLILKALNDTNNIESLEDTKAIIDSFEDVANEEFEHISAFCFKREAKLLAFDNFESYEEINPKDSEEIMKNININREFNILSTRARKGRSLKNLKTLSGDKAQTYGLEANEGLLQELKSNCDRTIKGILTGSRISNNVFDMMVLTPVVSWEYKLTPTGNIADKTEKMTLKYHLKLLRENGILIYNIPYTRLTNDMCFLISKLLDNVQVIRLNGSTIKRILIIGTKNQTRDPKENIYNMLKDLSYEDIGYKLKYKYNLASGGIKIPEIFRGSSLDKEEMQELINKSGLMDSFWKKNELTQNKDEARPLMPFNMGQIGLVLTSGCLDGKVEEYEGQYHAIKGMVTKIKHEESNSESNNEEVNIETISNKVQINIVTPNGDFIELA